MTELFAPRRQFRLIHGLALVALVAFVLAAVVRYRNADDELRCHRCALNLRMIGLALQEYHDAYNAFPPAYVADAEGRPMHSWRMLIVPYLEHTVWYPQYDWDEPWNGPNNMRLLRPIRNTIFACPLHPDHLAQGRTSYLAVTGRGTVFPPGGRSTNFGLDWKGVLPEPFPVVESADSDVLWWEPRDLDLDAPAGAKGPTLSSPHAGPCVLRLDGSVHRIGRGITRAEVDAALRPVDPAAPGP